MRYRFCGGNTIRDTETDGWAHDCVDHVGRMNKQDNEVKKLKSSLKEILEVGEFNWLEVKNIINDLLRPQ